MKKPHEIYKLHPDDTRYRHKLKLQLKETLSEKILSYCNAIKDQHWRPTVETVTAEYGSPPD